MLPNGKQTGHSDVCNFPVSHKNQSGYFHLYTHQSHKKVTYLSLTCQTEVSGPSVLTQFCTQTLVCRTWHPVFTVSTVKHTVRAVLVKYTF